MSMKTWLIGVTAAMLLLASCAREIPKINLDYKEWDRTTTVPLNYPIPGHENNFRRVFISIEGRSVTRLAINGVTHYDYPDGTQVIKEVYTGTEPIEGRDPSMLTVMIKAKDHPKARGGWLWIIKPLPDGKETVVDGEFCITCHANANEVHPYGDGNPDNEFRDYLFFPYPAPVPKNTAAEAGY